MVFNIKKEHPKMGTRKVYYLIKPDLLQANIKMGRDALFDLVAANNLQVTKRKRRYITTNSNHVFKKYPNQIRGIVPDGPDQIWVSDITYVPTREGWLYLATVQDLFSRKIVGWSMSHRIDRQLVMDALQMAVVNRRSPSGLLHHSDRGRQYASNDYQDLLEEHNMRCSKNT
jgi:transposase InsO family protein